MFRFKFGFNRSIVEPVCFGKLLPVVALAAAMSCNVASAQVGAAALSGVVQDSSGAVIPGASVVLQNKTNGQQRTLTSNGSGAFSFAAVPSGDYTLTVARTGFEKLENSAIHLNAGDALALPPVKLAVGAETTTVSRRNELRSTARQRPTELHRYGGRSRPALDRWA